MILVALWLFGVERRMKQPMLWLLLALVIVFAVNAANERMARGDVLIDVSD